MELLGHPRVPLVELFMVTPFRHLSRWKPQACRECVTETLLVLVERQRDRAEFFPGPFDLFPELGQFGFARQVHLYRMPRPRNTRIERVSARPAVPWLTLGVPHRSTPAAWASSVRCWRRARNLSTSSRIGISLTSARILACDAAISSRAAAQAAAYSSSVMLL
jgi:hypothetical protein